MAEILTQLAVWILPPIALPRALPTVIEGGVFEAAVIRSGASKLVASAADWLGCQPPLKRPLLRPELPKA